MACLDLSTRFVWALLLAHRAVDPPSSSLAEGKTPPLAPPPCGGAQLPDARSMRGDPHSELRANTRATKRGARNQISDRAPTIGGRTSRTRSSFCERGRQRRIPMRDPRERSEQSNRAIKFKSSNQILSC